MKTDFFRELLPLPLEMTCTPHEQNFVEVQMDIEQIFALPCINGVKQNVAEFIQQIPELVKMINAELVRYPDILPNFQLMESVKHNTDFRQRLFARFEQLGLFFEHQDIFMNVYEHTSLNALLYNIFDVKNRLIVMSLYSAAANYVNYILCERYVTPEIQEVLQQIKWCDAKNLTKMCTEYVQPIESKYVRLGIVIFRRSEYHAKRIIHTKAKLPPSLSSQDYVISRSCHFVENNRGKLCFGVKCEKDDKIAAGIMYKNCLIALGNIHELPYTNV